MKIEYQGINYDSSSTDWQDRDLKEEDKQIVIVDYPFNKSANIWFDHHESGWGKFVPTEFLGNFNPVAPSCCQVIFDTPGREKFKDEGLIKKIVDEINIVDYAMYPSIDSVYNPTTFGPKLRLADMHESDSCYKTELIKMFSNDRTLLYQLIDGHLPWSANWRFNLVQVKLEEGYKEFIKIAKEEDGVVFFDTPKFVKFDRYFPFRWKPNSIYTTYIRDMSYFGKGWHIAVSQNPWNIEKRKHNIKEICEKHGGGGHPGVGGIPISESAEKARKIMLEIKETLKC
jgi:hypothetical protein